jgi:DNA helicase II / ATP-dependent DNA helicase PcrA
MQTILDAAMGVIDRAQNRRRKKLFTDRGKGENIFFYEAPDDYAEASFVVDTIAQLVASRQFEPGDCAVMYRTNAMSRLLGRSVLAGAPSLSSGRRAALLRTARGQGHHRLPAPHPQPGR